MKQLKRNFLAIFSLLCILGVNAQDTEPNELKAYTYESLRALDYDAELAEQKDAEGLRAYLTGNILVGVWGKSNTRQYFAPSGTTWYQEADNPQSTGTWRVRDDGKYCSVWPPSRHESCYDVSFMDDVLFWHSGKHRYPSAIQVIIKDESEKDKSEDQDTEESEDSGISSDTSN